MARSTGELLPWTWAQDRLVAERHYWVATVTGRGLPHTRPVWGAFVRDGLFLSVGAAGFRKQDRRREVSVHVDSGVDVVILEGVAERVSSAAVPSAAADAYAQKYSMQGDWLNFRVAARVAWGWRDGDVNTATKWDLTVTMPSAS